MAMSRMELKARVCAEIDRQANRIIDISAHILQHPEIGFREHATAAYVAEQFAAMGLGCQTGLAITGVKARMKGRSSTLTVGILGELDSLLVPESPVADPLTHAAHACGHNAQIAAMLGAGLGLQSVMAELDGDVVLFAVPAEECITVEERLELRAKGEIEFIIGKPELIRIGAFDDIDMVTITHTPHGGDDSHASVGDTHNGALIKRVRFIGRAAHAGSGAQHGVNALKAATLALAAIDANRERFAEADMVRVSPIITKGGDGTSTVPSDVRVETMIRARSIEAMRATSEMVDRCLRAGALAIGAEVEIETISGYMPNLPDPNLVALQHAACTAIVGAEHMGVARHQAGSTDVGDVGLLMPAVHPRSGGTVGRPHAAEYYVRDHNLAAVNPAKSMAMLAVDLLCDGAAEGLRVRQAAGPKLSRAEYVALRRGFDSRVTFGPDGMARAREDAA
jgi:amidohydrolase